ncbi:MAG: hypothetical protein GXX96_29515 [Planctomycetaceae bacterium]|nr:hypothetical protein [Planctomycetaceae bacterium]
MPPAVSEYRPGCGTPAHELAYRRFPSFNSAASRISVPSWTIDDSRLKSLPMMLVWSLPAPSSEKNAV